MRFLLGSLMVLLLASCGGTEPVPYESIAWTNAYYIQNPISMLSPTAGGWLFRGARDYQGELRVGFLIPKPMSKNADERRAILNLACPAKFERIWQILPPENDLVIIVWTRDNKFKDSVTC